MSEASPAAPVGGVTAMPVWRWRWLILLVWPIGFALTAREMSPLVGRYAALTLIAILAVFFLLLRLRSVHVQTWPVWIGLLAFLLGYFIKFYSLVLQARNPTTLTTLVISPQRLDFAGQPEVALAAFQISTIGLVLFCAVFFVRLRPLGPNLGPFRSATAADVTAMVRTLTIAAVALLVATTMVALAFGILSMAELQERLPFRLGGWILYGRTTLLVTLILVVLQFGLYTGTRMWTRSALLIMGAYVVTEVLIRTTRGGVILAGLMLVVLYGIQRRRLDARIAGWGLAALSVGVVLFPIITAYRWLQFAGTASISLGAFAEALASVTAEEGLLAIAGLGLFEILQRFIGIDALLFLANPEYWPGLSGVMAARAAYGNLAEYMTHAVVGIPLDQVFAEAPSLLGFFLLAGGWPGLLLGFPLAMWLFWSLWEWIWHSRLWIKPVVQTHVLLTWLVLSSEGTFDVLILHFMALTTSLIGVEWAVRQLTVQRTVPLPTRAEPSRLAPGEGT